MRFMTNRITRVLLGSMVALAACDLLEPSDGQAPSDLFEARAMWASAGVDDYELLLDRSCFCPDPGPVRVRVEDGRKVSVTSDTASPEPIPLQTYPDVEGLFDLVDEALERQAHHLRVAYHPSLGYPTQVEVDYERRTADDEIRYQAALRVTPAGG